MKKYIFIGVIAGMAFLATAGSALACSCVVPDPSRSMKSYVLDAKSNATAIFVGTVVSVRYSEEKMNGTPIKRFAKFKVERSWKGPTTEFIEIESANICCICGIDFEAGQKWIVYSNSTGPDSLNASSCSRTSSVKDKSDDEKYLGKARKVKKLSK